MNQIQLPEFCLTLLPPWMQCIAAEHPSAKRLESRGYGVARQIGAWRGIIGLSQSKGFSSQYGEDDAIEDAIEAEHRHGMPYMRLGRVREWAKTAGKLWLAAELLDVLPPERCEGVDWHVPEQWGLILGRVWLLEPIACVGAVGAWRPGWCTKCKHVYASAARTHGRCRVCGAIFPECLMQESGRLHLNNQHDARIERPALKVVRELVV